MKRLLMMTMFVMLVSGLFASPVETNDAVFNFNQPVKIWNWDTGKIQSDTWNAYAIFPSQVFATNWPGPGTNSFPVTATIVSYATIASGVEKGTKWFDYADYACLLTRLSNQGAFEIDISDNIGSVMLGKVVYDPVRKIVTGGALDGTFTDAADNSYGTCSLDLNHALTKLAATNSALIVVEQYLQKKKYHPVAPSITIVGGTSTNYTFNGTNYTAWIFADSTNAGTFVVSGSSLNCEVLIVAGGGGGGAPPLGGAGGGAGGLIYTNVTLSPGSYSVVVGAGGAPAPQVMAGNNGSNSVFGSLTAIGGGGGGTWNGTSLPGLNGGSGGGGGGSSVESPPAFGLGTSGQGNDGGNAVTAGYGIGGGGGAGAVGGAGIENTSGAGGAGLAYDISGTNTYYAGGGGGCTYVGGGGTPGAGGIGGGGAGSTGLGADGQPNTGGGGGGSDRVGSPTVGSAGGSGIVIIRYPSLN